MVISTKSKKIHIKINPGSKTKTGNRENRSLKYKVIEDKRKNMLSPIKLHQTWCTVEKSDPLVATEKRPSLFHVVEAFSKSLLG